jgi:DNA invertase Pin-like site-specific DNA recombinase
MAPIERPLVVEGISTDRHIGAFRGTALATGLRSPSADDFRDPFFLVDDPRKATPVWVRGSEIQRSRSPIAAKQPVIGYVTLRAGAQQEAVAHIEAACREASWRLTEVVFDQAGPGPQHRPGLAYALREIAEGRACALVVSDLRGMIRSVLDLGVLLERLREARAVLVALDLDLDTGTAYGDEVAAHLITLRSWERQRIVDATRRSVARAKAEGRPSGPPAVKDHPELLRRIAQMREDGMTLQGIADELNSASVPTMRGGRVWRPSSVQTALGYRPPAAGGTRDHALKGGEDATGE